MSNYLTYPGFEEQSFIDLQFKYNGIRKNSNWFKTEAYIVAREYPLFNFRVSKRLLDVKNIENDVPKDEKIFTTILKKDLARIETKDFGNSINLYSFATKNKMYFYAKKAHDQFKRAEQIRFLFGVLLLITGGIFVFGFWRTKTMAK